MFHNFPHDMARNNYMTILEFFLPYNSTTIRASYSILTFFLPFLKTCRMKMMNTWSNIVILVNRFKTNIAFPICHFEKMRLYGKYY